MEALRKLGCLFVIIVAILLSFAAIGSQMETSRRAISGTPTGVVAQVPSTVVPSTPMPTLVQATVVPTPLAPPTPTQAPSNDFDLSTTFTRDSWAVTPFLFWEYEIYTFGRKPTSRPQGKYYVAQLLVQNRQNTVRSISTGDFTMRSPDGRQFIPSSETIFVERGFLFQNVQPGLSANVALVFDLDPRVTNWTITALGIPFVISSLDKATASPTPR